LPGSEASLADVLAPCDAHAIRQRFALDEQDLSMLRHRLEGAGVSWGLDAAQRQRTNDYASSEGSWRAGVDRLLLGLITGPDAQVLPGQYASGGQLSGDADAVGGIAVYLGILQRFAEEAGDGSLAKPVSAWRTLLFGLLADLADAQRGPDARALAVLRGAIAAIPMTGADPDLRTIRKHLARMLDEEQHASTWSRGGITVAPLSVLRHAPHAMIAILGLDSSFPRIHTASAFDPAAAVRRRGDLSARLDARQLFLDLLLAARTRVHLSWTGWSSSDGSPREASSTIEDLLRHLDTWLTASDDQKVGRALVLVNHRLHASDAAYFNGTLPRSHDVLACAAAGTRRARDAGIEAPGVQPFLLAPNASEAPAILAPDDLLAWCRDPAKQYCEQVLGLRFPRHDTLAEHEPIALDGLESWHLRQEVVDGLLDGHPVQEARLRQDGLLPHGPAGTHLLAECHEEAASLAATLDAVLAREGCTRDDVLLSTRSIDVALPGDGAPRRIVGSVRRCAPRIAVVLHSGSLKGAHLLDAWVLHQLLNAHARSHQEEGLSTVLIGHAGGHGALKALRGCCCLPASAANEEHWRSIATALRDQWRRPQPFFPDLAAACWQWDGHQIRAESLDPHLAAWRGGADDLEDSDLRSELATPRPWTRLVWRGDADPTAQWAWFIDHLWAPAAQAARAAHAGAERAP
jgi:exodeoxyribonuclease V gamma subunit